MVPQSPGPPKQATGLLPNALAAKLTAKVGVDRLASLHTASDVVWRGGTISVSGVYGGAADPIPMLRLPDKQVRFGRKPTCSAGQ
jgi:hypothetical protein